MKIERILICGQEQPAAVDRESLQFSWQLASGQENCMQSAYQIRVIEERSGLVMWDTGHVQSSKSTGLIYKGSALKPAQRYRLDLCVWDECSHACEPSHTWFGTGLSPHEWQAKDIWKPQEHRTVMCCSVNPFPSAPLLSRPQCICSHIMMQCF